MILTQRYVPITRERRNDTAARSPYAFIRWIPQVAERTRMPFLHSFLRKEIRPSPRISETRSFAADFVAPGAGPE
jgi:hypothetical protein